MLDFKKMRGKVMVIVQHWQTKEVLMCGVMTKRAFEKTCRINKVTFWSRTKKRLWTKGESSGNFLIVEEILEDCDGDTLLIMADPVGPTCHTGAKTCFKEVGGIPRLFRKEEREKNNND